VKDIIKWLWWAWQFALENLRSSVKCPAMSADHPLTPECHDDQQWLEDVEFSRALWKD